MELEKFVTFKESFVEIAKNEFNACDRFVEEINNAKTILEFKQVLHNYSESIFEHLGGECDTQYFEGNIYELEMYIEELEKEVEKYDVIETIHDDMKYKTYLELNSKYTPWEFEELLLNGKL